MQALNVSPRRSDSLKGIILGKFLFLFNLIGVERAVKKSCDVFWSFCDNILCKKVAKNNLKRQK